MKIGYARVSTEEQTTDPQTNALKAAGCERIFLEKASGGKWDRPELQRALEHLREGDVLVVWKLDRLTRSLADLLFIIDKVSQTKAGFQSLTENIDTTTAAGRMIAQMVGVFAEFERSIVKERTKAGLDAAKKRGVRLGARPKLNTLQRDELTRMVVSGEKTAAEAARIFKVNPSTACRILQEGRGVVT